LYATKHGAAGEVAKRIAAKIGASELFNLKQKDIPMLNQFDCVIIGSSVYAGMIRGEAKRFVKNNADVLKSKRLGLFLSCMNTSDDSKYFEMNFPPEIVRLAKAKECMGGIFDPQKAGAIGRFIMKIAAKKTEYTDNISDEKISSFAEIMQS
jgi:menaquinone-dependent protoporphyrinogen oxidase